MNLQSVYKIFTPYNWIPRCVSSCNIVNYSWWPLFISPWIYVIISSIKFIHFIVCLREFKMFICRCWAWISSDLIKIMSSIFFSRISINFIPGIRYFQCHGLRSCCYSRWREYNNPSRFLECYTITWNISRDFTRVI